MAKKEFKDWDEGELVEHIQELGRRIDDIRSERLEAGQALKALLAKHDPTNRDATPRPGDATAKGETVAAKRGVRH